MEIICEPICQTVNTLRKLCHWLPIHIKTMNLEQIKEYVDNALVEANNKQLRFAKDSDNCWCVYFKDEPVILIIE